MKKIMFDDKFGLTQDVLEKIKTMTRRMIPQKTVDFILNDFRREYFEATLDRLDDKECIEQYFLVEKIKEPPYKVGEIVAIAQSYSNIFDEADKGDYWADCYEAFRQIIAVDTPGWKNKMFVRADVMPHHIRITNIKIERLQDISDEDCMKEGVLRREIMPFRTIEIKYQVPKTVIYKDNPRDAFAALINKVSGKSTWESNPWAFAYSFERID